MVEELWILQVCILPSPQIATSFPLPREFGGRPDRSLDGTSQLMGGEVNGANCWLKGSHREALVYDLRKGAFIVARSQIRLVHCRQDHGAFVWAVAR